ncbi:unnamed protein product [Auanema sp. JU1783]|nr:unnamed protein product [Auanema sp. JU1783]
MCDAKLKTKYALFCSVPNADVLPKLSEFSTWFLQSLSKEATTIGLYYDFESNPTTIVQIKPGDLEGCAAAYEALNKENPSVQLVLHILPGAYSDEYDWMKSLATRFGLVRQGVLFENALNRFATMKHDEVFKNVAQWISRSLYKLCNSRNIGDRAIDIRVGTSKVLANVKAYNPQLIQSAVSLVLHGTEPSVCREESAVSVEGFSSALNEYGVSQLFDNLCVTGVSLTPNGAVVTFVNKFHAYQACSLNNTFLDRVHTLRVRPLSKEQRESRLRLTESFTLWCSPDNPQKRLEAKINRNNASYVFQSPTVADSGEYSCDLQTLHGRITGKINVYVRPLAASNDEHFTAIKDFNVAAPRVQAVAGSDVNLTCPVLAYPKPAIFWKKDNKPVELSENVIVDGSTIRIKNIDENLVGHYSCEARNEYNIGGRIYSSLLVIERDLIVKSELAWIWPLLVIILILVTLVVIIFICEIRKKRQNKQSRYSAQE